MQATVGMYGDLQGIAGKTLKEIEELELLALPDHSSVENLSDSPTLQPILRT